MTLRLRLIPRLALFSALIYVLNLGTMYLPNMSLMFFVIFSAGYLWGAGAGAVVGAFGMGLWTTFNPYGPAAVPIALTQIAGASASGLIGAAFRHPLRSTGSPHVRTGYLALSAILCIASFYLPVNAIDAWLFQPFWPRFITSALWTLIGLGANVLIFPLLFPITKMLYERECARSSFS